LPPAATAALPTVAAEPELATAIGEALALTELKGQQTGTQKVVIERGPVRVFAEALGDASDAYTGDGAPVPPRFPFVMPYWGSLGTGGAPGLPIDRLRGPDRAILHGEQAFEYHRWPKVGDVLEGTTVITDVYEKERSNGGKLEFYVTETDWKDADSGKPIVKSIFTLVVNVRPSS
jgi:N-terminal half of MaoC dehydratase